jgi:hypothetical protein
MFRCLRQIGGLRPLRTDAFIPSSIIAADRVRYGNPKSIGVSVNRFDATDGHIYCGAGGYAYATADTQSFNQLMSANVDTPGRVCLVY